MGRIFLGMNLEAMRRHEKPFEWGAPVVNTDEGIKASWTTEEEEHVLMPYMLYQAAAGDRHRVPLSPGHRVLGGMRLDR
jgi:hypothetical protein